MPFQIQLRDNQTSFCPAKRPRDQEWIDTSIAQSTDAIGHLQFPGVRPGNYESKHPILDEHGTRVGFLIDGASTVGYTYACVYAGNCFWIAHATFAATMHSGNGAVSLIEPTGTFLLPGRGMKFEKVRSFPISEVWADLILVFKLLDGGAFLLYLTKEGFCLFDVSRRELVAKADFSGFFFPRSGFALSPKVKLLAIGGSARSHQDPQDGAYRYRNFIRIYQLETGVVVGEQTLPGDQETAWHDVEFSEDGRQVRATSSSSSYIFDLMTS